MLEPHRKPLAQLGIFWQPEIEDTSINGRMRIIDRLHQAICNERRLARLDPTLWAYSLPRHETMLRVYRKEYQLFTASAQRLEI